MRSGDGRRDRYAAALADPDRPECVLTWLLSKTSDPMGNRIAYWYTRDGAQRYLTEIRYVDLADSTQVHGGYLVKIRLRSGPRPDPLVDRRAQAPAWSA